MGYKKSFNLVTIQLIMPLSTMTKAEYKNAYGIDLDDIDIEKVTLLQDEGSKNKYFVDEIKATESGVNIYAGGKILSIGSSVSVVNNAYSVDNAKPIYLHPITIQYSSNEEAGTNAFVSLLIFDNSSEEYNTYAKFRAKLEEILEKNPLAVFPLTGAVYYQKQTIYIAQKIGFADDDIRIYAISSNTGELGYFNISTYIVNATFYDGVNKIN